MFALGLGIVALGFAAGTVLGLVSHLHDVAALPPPPSTTLQNPLDSLRAVASRAELVSGGAVRRVFRYSIIPGGAYSAEEASFATQGDAVVATHYHDLVLATMSARRVATTRAVHVSYRVGDRVYWTRHKVLLQAGETVLTDGENEVRARCGNRVSDVPRSPVIANEPPLEETFVLPFGDTAPLPLPPLLASRDLPVPNVPVAPMPDTRSRPDGTFVPPIPVPPMIPPVDPPPTVVPEPSSVLLIGTGLAIAAIRRLRRGRPRP